jgi:hypothetical protein
MDLQNKIVTKQDYGGKVMVVLSWNRESKELKMHNDAKRIINWLKKLS